MRMLLLGLLALLILLQYRLWFAEGSLAERARLREEIVQQEALNVQLRERNAVLEREVIELKNGLDGLEQRAREELGLVREGEVYYQFVPRDQVSEMPADEHHE